MTSFCFFKCEMLSIMYQHIHYTSDEAVTAFPSFVHSLNSVNTRAYSLQFRRNEHLKVWQMKNLYQSAAK